MCVNTEHYKCCSCFSMTTATLILGALYLIGCVCDAVIENWFGFAVSLIISLLMMMVLVKPHDVYIRKILYRLVASLTLISFAVLIAVFIYLCASDSWIDDACRNGTETYEDYTECQDYAKSYMVIGMLFFIAMYTLISFCTLQILYYGWKEQMAIAEERQASGIHDP